MKHLIKKRRIPRLRPLLIAILVVAFLPHRTTALNTPIIACASSIELERAFSFFCQPGDNVLELGAQFSDASRSLCTAIQPGGNACLADIARSNAKSGRCTQRDVNSFLALEGVTVMELPSLDDWNDVIFSSNAREGSNSNNNNKFDVISIDLGSMIGNDLYLSTLSLANDILSIAPSPPRVMIVKSHSLASLSRRLIPAPHILEGHTLLEKEVADNKEDGRERAAGSKKNKEPYLLASVGVEEYRRLIPTTVEKGDVVLEVGCHFGRSTHLLNEAARGSSLEGVDEDDSAGYCVGVDIGPKIIKNAQKQYPSIQFAVGDAWKTLDLLKLRQDGVLGYDVVYADIGGLSGPHGTLEALSLLDSLANALEPRSIVIKSLCMKRLASRLRSFRSVWAKKGAGGGANR